MPQLDALRTFAVLLVVIYHWFPTDRGFNYYVPNGTIGVMIFFVISGFLITRILLDNRNRWLDGQVTLGETYRKFFIRRALRIFPLYYLIISLVWLLIPEASDVDKYPLYYYLYGYNILLHKTGNWSDLLSPFWTLGVEEQLYLVWPWIVFLTPRASLQWVICGMVMLGIAFRGFGFLTGDLDGVLTPANVDSFGLGALWAWLIVDQPQRIPAFLNKLTLVAIVAFIAFIGFQFLPNDLFLVVLFQRFVISVVSLFLVVQASIGFNGLTGAVFNNAALRYTGRISYGIYVFHMIVPGYLVPFFIRLVNRFVTLPAFGFWTHRLFSFGVLLVLASVSWFLFEKPINELKRYFSYKNT